MNYNPLTCLRNSKTLCLTLLLKQDLGGTTKIVETLDTKPSSKELEYIPLDKTFEVRDPPQHPLELISCLDPTLELNSNTVEYEESTPLLFSNHNSDMMGTPSTGLDQLKHKMTM